MASGNFQRRSPLSITGLNTLSSSLGLWLVLWLLNACISLFPWGYSALQAPLASDSSGLLQTIHTSAYTHWVLQADQRDTHTIRQSKVVGNRQYRSQLQPGILLFKNATPTSSRVVW